MCFVMYVYCKNPKEILYITLMIISIISIPMGGQLSIQKTQYVKYLWFYRIFMDVRTLLLMHLTLYIDGLTIHDVNVIQNFNDVLNASVSAKIIF